MTNAVFSVGPKGAARIALLAMACLGPVLLPAAGQAQDRAARVVEKMDQDGDGRISRGEWRGSAQKFLDLDSDGDGYVTVSEFRPPRFGGGGGARSMRKEEAANRGPTTAEPALPRVAGLPELYFVDAHSQMARGLDPSVILPLMDKAGVWHTILSARNDRKPNDVAQFAERHPSRITAAVRSKGRAFNDNWPKFRTLIERQMSKPVFKAMAEAILFHAQKGERAPEIRVSIDSPQSMHLLDAARRRGWPYIVHYEFGAAGWDRDGMMKEFEAAVAANADHPFVLIHMGQLDAKEAARLIEAHPNLHFMTSHSNPVNIAAHPNQPWSNLFDDGGIAPQWQALFVRHPKRFILAFDNVFPEFWGDFYLEQVALWRKALQRLPKGEAHAIAHGNAERLWKLPVPKR